MPQQSLLQRVKEARQRAVRKTVQPEEEPKRIYEIKGLGTGTTEELLDLSKIGQNLRPEEEDRINAILQKPIKQRTAADSLYLDRKLGKIPGGYLPTQYEPTETRRRRLQAEEQAHQREKEIIREKSLADIRRDREQARLEQGLTSRTSSGTAPGKMPLDQLQEEFNTLDRWLNEHEEEDAMTGELQLTKGTKAAEYDLRLARWEALRKALESRGAAQRFHPQTAPADTMPTIERYEEMIE